MKGSGGPIFAEQPCRDVAAGVHGWVRAPHCGVTPGCGKQFYIPSHSGKTRAPPLHSRSGHTTTSRGTQRAHSKRHTSPTPCIDTMQHSLGEVAASEKQHQGHSHKRTGADHGGSQLLKGFRIGREWHTR